MAYLRSRSNRLRYEVVSRPIAALEAARHVEGRRSSLKDALRLARNRWHEYKQAAKIEVLLDGVAIADDPSDFTMRSW